MFSGLRDMGLSRRSTGFSRRLDGEPLDGPQRRFVEALVKTRHELRAPELEDFVREELLASRESLAQLLRG